MNFKESMTHKTVFLLQLTASYIRGNVFMQYLSNSFHKSGLYLIKHLDCVHMYKVF